MPRRQLWSGAMQGIFTGLDPYTRYHTPEEWADRRRGLSGEFSGIGVWIVIDPEARRPCVRGVFVGSAAHAYGIREGDLIVTIDGRSTEGLTIEQVVAVLPGQTGTIVDVSVLHEGEKVPVDFSIPRAPVHTPSVRAGRRGADGLWSEYMYDEARRIGYLRISRMADDTLDRAQSALAGLAARGVRGLVLDLRHNTGGLQAAATAVADLLIDAGQLIAVDGRDGTEKVYDATPGGYTDFPVVVLINEQTASSGEVLAAALQDNGRGMMIGARTFGKGLQQQLFMLGDNAGALTITAAVYRRTSGKHYDRYTGSKDFTDWGIAPEPGLAIALEEGELEAWLEENVRRDGPALLIAGDALTQDTPGSDRVLECGLEMLRSAIAE